MAEIIEPPKPMRAGGPGLSYWLGTKIGNQPLAMRVEQARWLQSQIQDRAFDASVDLGHMSKFIGQRDSRSAYRVTDDGIALVPVQGVLIDRGDWLGDMGGFATSYEGLAEQMRRLSKDQAVKAIVLDIDSPGGMAAGLFDVVREIEAVGKKKPVYAVAANMAASAAYAIACAAEKIYVTRLGLAGSIGVITVHMSYAGMLEKSGIEPTIIIAGERKADGNPYQALGHAARADMADAAEDIYRMFVAHVASRRRLDESAVRATQARVYTGDKAVSARLADGVKSVEETLEKIRKGLGSNASSSRGTTPTNGGRTVSTKHQPAASQSGLNEPQIEAALAGYLAGLQASAKHAPAKPKAAAPAAPAPEAPVQPAAADPRARIKEILSCEEAKGRTDLANYLAFDTELDIESCKAALSRSASDSSSGLGSALASQMAKPGASAGIKPEAGGGGGQPSLADRVAAKYAKPSKRS